MKTDNWTAPAVETFLAMQRVTLAGAEALAELNAEAVKSLARQAAAAEPLAPSATTLTWAAREAGRLPAHLQESLQLTRRAYAICATTTADWLEVCAERTDTLSEHSLAAIERLTHLLPAGAPQEAGAAQELRERLQAAHRAYQGMIAAFRAANDSLTEAPAAVTGHKRGRA